MTVWNFLELGREAKEARVVIANNKGDQHNDNAFSKGRICKRQDENKKAD